MQWTLGQECFEAQGSKGLYQYGDFGGGKAIVRLPDGSRHFVPWDDARNFCEGKDKE